MLSIDDVTKIDERRKQIKKEIYKKFMNSSPQRLNNLSSMDTNKSSSLYPHFL
jgi:hypothetical protein